MVNNIDPAQAPLVVPAHFTLAGEQVLLYLARPNPVWPHLEAAGQVRLAVAGDYAYVKVERPAGRTTLTAARTGVSWSAVGAVDRRSEEHGLGLEAMPRCLAPSA